MKLKKITAKHIMMIPIVLAIGIIPLIIRVTVHSNERLAQEFGLPQSYYKYADIFLACKAAAIQILMAVMAVILIYCVIGLKRKLPWDGIFIPVLAYLFFVLLSGALSQYGSLAFWGSYERFEPVGVIFGYIMIFYYSYNFTGDKEGMHISVKMSGVPVGIMILLGILQSIGLDPFNLTLIKKLIVPFSLHDKLDNLQLIREKGVAYLTLYNEDYLGMYFALIIPVCIALVFAAGTMAGRITSSVFTLALFFVLYHGRSLSGWIALAGAGIAAVMIVSSRSKKGVIISWACLGLAVSVLISVLEFAPALRDRVQRILSSSSGRVHKITQLETGDNEVVFYYFDGNELHCKFDFDDNGMLNISFTDKNGEQIVYYDNMGESVLEERYAYADAKAYPWQMEDIRAVMFEIDEHQWPMVRGEDGYYYLDNELNRVKAHRTDNAGIFDETFLSGRGGIWNRTIPLIGRHIFTGSGANTFITEYPQNDYVTLNYLYGWGYTEYNVKAHSLYLGNMIENGLIGTLCLMAFFVMYIIKGTRVYCKPFDDDKEGRFVYYLGFGIFLGCISYMISGMVNDSNVCTAPVFWAFMGVSVRNIRYVSACRLI